MRTIPNIYWDVNYNKPPSLLQRAWVQRWLEILDPNTSYVYTPPLVNIVSVLDEIVNSFINNQERTYYFQLCELNQCVKTDPILLSGGYSISGIVNSLLCKANELFDSSGNGCIKANLASKKSRVENFNKDFEEFRSTSCKVFLNYFLKNNFYRNQICHALRSHLLHGKIDHYNIYKKLNELSKNLIIELLTRANYSSSFLISQCVDIFLKEKMKEDFDERLSELLNKFNQPTQEFSVFMRIQARKIIRDIDKIGEVSFKTSLPQMIPKIEEISDKENWDADREGHAKDFFYQGHSPENLIFAVVDNISAEDPGNASIQALSKLAMAMNQAKFEYELKNLSIDRRVYAYEKSNDNLFFISSKQLRKSRYGSLGDPLRLENFLSWLSQANHSNMTESEESKKDEDEKKLRQNIIDRVTKTALAWHREALESDTSETKFINHWISLEQIFKPLKRNKIKCKNSTADKTVLALANILSVQFNTQILLDIWGDIKRTGFLGPPRIIARNNGLIEYSRQLLKTQKMERFYYVPDNEFSRPELYLIPDSQNRNKYIYKLQPKSIVFIRDRRSVNKGDWISGLLIDTTYFPHKKKSPFRYLF